MVGGIELLRPEYVQQWLLDTTRHVISVEFFLARLQIGGEDPQRPHDIMGEGNKFSVGIVKGMAMQYGGRQHFQEYVCPALQRHRRGQYHHQMWGEPFSDPSSRASEDACKLGAIDAICSLLEDRRYQGGSHTYGQIVEEILPQNNPVKRDYMAVLIPEMQRIEQPHLELITSLNPVALRTELKTIDLPENIRAVVGDRLNDILTDLASEGITLQCA